MARRSTKARVEGAPAAKQAEAQAAMQAEAAAVIDEEIAAGAKAISAALAEPDAIEDKPADPVPGDNGAALDRISAYFQEKHPEDWENIRLTPLQHGLIHMAELLRARG